ncbi:hypothetical protein [Sediminispirochaeta bajacaliforniensis]|uniref:hypothetical protein n=1 Tax=Sediminispirochaeta bajacaliforniensis TaxID=148 RepID=UPI00036802D5|nr:hypothetical protein [Sediminispirochaeta bajacaliforniensis]
METYELVALVVRLSLGGVTTFLAIMLWSSTRDSAWMLVIMAAILFYGNVMYQTLRVFGVVGEGIFLIPGVLHVSVVLENLPILFLAFGFIAALWKKRRR